MLQYIFQRYKTGSIGIKFNESVTNGTNPNISGIIQTESKQSQIGRIIWMGTDDGLYCYNIVGNRLMNFDKREDTQGQVYYPLACMKGMDGLIYFGGTNGFTVIDPKKISYNNIAHHRFPSKCSRHHNRYYKWNKHFVAIHLSKI